MSNNRQFSDDYTSVNVENRSEDSSQSNSHFYLTDPKIKKLKDHVTKVLNIMPQNFDKIFERGSRLDYLEDRSEMMSNRADPFSVSGRRVSPKMWWQNMKINISIGVVVFIIILVIIVSLIESKLSK